MTSHLRLVPPAPSKIPDVEMFAFAQIGDDVFICFRGEWDLAQPGRPGYDAFVKWAREIEALAATSEPLPWPLPKGAA